MDVMLGGTVDGKARTTEAAQDELRSLRPNRARWRAVASRSAPRPAREADPWPAAAALAGLAGATSLAVLAGVQPDLGGCGPAALAAALAAACAPVAVCLRLVTAALDAGDTSLEREKAEIDARERYLGEQVAAARHAASDPAADFQPDPKAAARPGTAMPRMRRHARIKPRQRRTLIATEDGRRLNALIIDVSQSGVAIEGNLPGLWIGSMVRVGSRRAKAVRVLPRGMAFEFSLPVPVEELTVDLVL